MNAYNLLKEAKGRREKQTLEQGQRAKEGRRRVSRQGQVWRDWAGTVEKVRCEPSSDREECERQRKQVSWRP